VVERQLDQLGEHGLVEHEQHARRDARGRRTGRLLGGRSDDGGVLLGRGRLDASSGVHDDGMMTE
jgi:hypothetical protein